MKVTAHHALSELTKIRRKTHDTRLWVRLMTVIQAAKGETAAEIARINGYSRRAVQQWVKRYNNEGLDGLFDRPRKGRPKKLTPKQERILIREFGNPEANRAGKVVQKFIRQQFQVKYTLDGVYKLMSRLNIKRARKK